MAGVSGRDGIRRKGTARPDRRGEIMSSVPASGPSSAGQITARLTGGMWAIAVGTGVISVLLGLIIVVWPEATIGVVAVLFGLKLIFHGIYRVMQAIATGE